ncbi:hypothetical protein [Jeotgalibacillus sp. R-1-5s-1]|uniref:hypothetical protein n=1 Tax=Jeotgalibacillus sp. R-1-5s-1 TaxID=2555897 RepID=UPI00106DB2BB|nr:hypothetical protein [Jeotgalibacillus sp. R-1-5s-1]TFD98397.1 hypothetical protein E2491_08140 [Jeotgalibacillus sp. R-1-5s-1]
MFQLKDMWTFLWSFLIVFPTVSLIHQLGHAFFAKIFGGTCTFALGRGKKLFCIGPISVHTIYFLDSFCKYTDLKTSNRLTHCLVHLGGVIFNLGSILLINVLIMQDIIKPDVFYYQYAYFSVYFAAFSLLPVNFGNGKYSDGYAAYRILKYKQRIQLEN